MSKQVCFICDSSEVNDLELGEFKKKGKISVHYFCLVSSICKCPQELFRIF